jgi:hypothetical protein
MFSGLIPFRLGYGVDILRLVAGTFPGDRPSEDYRKERADYVYEC